MKNPRILIAAIFLSILITEQVSMTADHLASTQKQPHGNENFINNEKIHIVSMSGMHSSSIVSVLGADGYSMFY